MAISPFLNFTDEENSDAQNDPSNFPIDEQITKLEDLPNGDSVYQLGELEELQEQQDETEDFYRNLMDDGSSSSFGNIVTDLLDAIEDDIESRHEWEDNYTKAMKLLGFKLEESRDYPFVHACAAFDSTLSTALLRFYSTARAEIFPNNGPAKFQVVGESSEELEQQGNRVQAWMNYYLCHVDKDYYPDSERLLMYLGLVGCAFRKSYQDPISKRPVARFIDPQDFIVDNKARSISSAGRLTHRMYLTKKELVLRQLSGFYSGDVSIPDEPQEDLMQESLTTKTVRQQEGISNVNMSERSTYIVYEVHADLDLNGFEHEDEDGQPSGVPLPYIVTISYSDRKLLSIRRNWEEDDLTYKRIECFTHYNYLPGFGMYGIGLSQLLGSNSNVLTSLTRQLVDAGTFANFPGGVKIKGLRSEQNDKPIGPGEWMEIDTGGLPIGECLMPMPYKEPSVVLKELRNELIQQTQNLASTADTQISDARAEAPVGTTLALLEVQNRVQSSVMRGLHMSLSNELELLYRLFGEGMDEENPYDFKTAGLSAQITKHDFSNNIKIIPVSDPNLTTSTQRILRAEAMLRLAEAAPQLHDLRDAYHRMYVAMGVDNIDRLLPPEQDVLPLDPITENMNMMEGKPVKAAVWQDHTSHIAVHHAFSEQNPDIEAVAAHVQEHRAFEYYMQMQYEMGMELPPLEQLEDPQIQNQIAQAASQVAMEQREQMAAENPPPPDPNTVMMADVEARKEIAALKMEEAKLKAEVESFKAQLAFETAKNKVEADKELAIEKNAIDVAIAEEKNETDLIMARMKQESDAHKTATTAATKLATDHKKETKE